MISPTRYICLFAIFGVSLIGPQRSKADFIFTFEEQGSDVVLTAQGSLDLTNLTLASGGAALSLVHANISEVITSPPGNFVDAYSAPSISGPASIGSGTVKIASSGSGDAIGIAPDINRFYVPQGYTSGTQLFGQATFANETFASLGLDLGTYVFTDGGNTVTISVVPEPHMAGMLVVAAFVMCPFNHRSRRQKPA